MFRNEILSQQEEDKAYSKSKFWEALKEGRTAVIMDTETTGFTAKDCDVIEVSAVKVKLAPPGSKNAFTVLGTYDSYINPGYPLPERIVEFNREAGTGICDEFLSIMPDAQTVAEELDAFFHSNPDIGSDPILVGHNIESFDVPFIEKLLKADKKELPFTNTFDTLRIAKAEIPFQGKGTHKLTTLHPRTRGNYAAMANNAVAHTSIYDCLMTLDLTEHFIESYLKEYEEVRTLEPAVPEQPHKKKLLRKQEVLME